MEFIFLKIVLISELVAFAKYLNPVGATLLFGNLRGNFALNIKNKHMYIRSK